ncbi:Hypothetical_protein [Hexamita inflata]|uniref:Hypothetical_protein n=1 Tax=Hexamita inflata TaxID=28002 RepID=A0AA86QNC9_9EUKA|nr:Hypothetical protein HINF_LOCUS50539 [Hexamita inflata]
MTIVSSDSLLETRFLVLFARYSFRFVREVVLAKNKKQSVLHVVQTLLSLFLFIHKKVKNAVYTFGYLIESETLAKVRQRQVDSNEIIGNYVIVKKVFHLQKLYQFVTKVADNYFLLLNE